MVGRPGTAKLCARPRAGGSRPTGIPRDDSGLGCLKPARAVRFGIWRALSYGPKGLRLDPEPVYSLHGGP